MKNLLYRIIAPLGVVGLVFSVTWWAQKMDFIPDAVAYWLWPALIAAMFLAFAVLAVLRDARLWVWPLGTGFVVQTAGIFLLMARVLESPWEPLWYALGAVGVVLCVMGAIWLVNTMRARNLERRMAEGLAEGTPGNEQELGRIRKDMMDALSLLRRAGRGRNAIYELPWLLVMGRPAAGKTVAIKNSGLNLPVRKDWVKGVGGTYTCDWFFTNELIFLDTPGKWVTEGADEGARKQWQQLLRLLRKFRGRRPLDGLIVVVPADDLLSKDDAGLEEQAGNVREVVDRIHEELGFRFPVYLLVSKCDLVEGFTDFFRGLPAQRRHEILGWSNEDPNRTDALNLVRSGFGRVQRHLEAYRLEMLGRIASRTQARKLFFFPEDFKALERPLSVFADSFFQSDRFHEAPVFRGFYFTSGTQGEGTPLSKAMSQLARSLGVDPDKAHASTEEEPKRSYFLLDLFRELMIEDEGLVGRTAGHWWRQRRQTMLGAFAPAGLAVTVVLLAVVSLLWNRGIYNGLAERGPEIARELAGFSGELASEKVLPALERTGELHGYHRKISTFSPLRSWGMRRPGELADESMRLFQQQFRASVLEPTLEAAQGIATSDEYGCTERIDVLHSVVWLRMGRRAQWSADLAGFDRVWGLASEPASRARKDLLRQYVTYKAGLDPTDSRNMLPGFSIRDVSRSIKESCGNQGSTSALEMYRGLQEQCASATSDVEIVECATRLNEVLRYRQEDYERFAAHFNALKNDLAELEVEEAEAKSGSELLATIDIVQGGESNECLTRFSDKILPVIRDYAVQDGFLEECRAKVEVAGTRGEKFKARNDLLLQQQQQLDGQEKDLGMLMADYNTSCRDAVPGFRRLDMDLLKRISTGDRRVRCMGVVEAPAPARAAATTAAVTPRPKKRTPRAAKPPALRWLQTDRAAPRGYDRARWQEKKHEWAGLLEAAQVGFTDAQRNLEKNKIRGEVGSYASSYSTAWLRYLEGLRLKPRQPAVADWLEQLSSTTEYTALLGPAAEAAAVAEEATDPPFDEMKERLRPLSGLGSFVSSGLSEYQALLGAIAEDLHRSADDAEAFRKYRAAVLSGSRENSLAKAHQWIDRKAGPSLAENRLHDFLEGPLVEADAFVRSDNLLKSQWGDLTRLYDAEVKGRAPFDGGADAEPISVEGLKAFLGRATGAVTRVREAAGEGSLSRGAEAWLERAEKASAIFFGPDSDELRPIRARFNLQGESYDPAEVASKLQVKQIRVFLGQNADFVWEEGKDRMKRLDLVLFGDEASDYSYVRGVLMKRKGLVGRTIGGNWESVDAVEDRVVEGALAPIRLIQQGLANGGPVSGEEIDLEYTLEFPLKKQKTAKASLAIRLSGEEVAGLLRLMERGLEGPPAEAVGG